MPQIKVSLKVLLKAALPSLPVSGVHGVSGILVAVIQALHISASMGPCRVLLSFGKCVSSA